jgi:hypothetical protein
MASLGHEDLLSTNSAYYFEGSLLRQYTATREKQMSLAEDLVQLSFLLLASTSMPSTSSISGWTFRGCISPNSTSIYSAHADMPREPFVQLGKTRYEMSTRDSSDWLSSDAHEPRSGNFSASSFVLHIVTFIELPALAV